MTISIRSGLSVGLLLVLATAASAGKMSAEADTHFAAGSKAFEAKDYGTAIDEFWFGYMIDPQPDFLYAIGQAYRAAGLCSKAKAAYDAFKRTKPPKKKAAKADANMARCEEAPVKVATKPPEPTPPPTASATPPARGADDPGAATKAENEAKPETPPPATGGTLVTRTTRAPWYTDWLGDSLAVGGFVALGVGAFLWTGARSDLDEANEPATYRDYASYLRGVESASRKQTIGVVTFAAGGALMTAAVLRWWLRPGADPPVEARAGRGGGMVFYTTRF
jgi:hypothetical protein